MSSVGDNEATLHSAWMSSSLVNFGGANSGDDELMIRLANSSDLSRADRGNVLLGLSDEGIGGDFRRWSLAMRSWE